MDKHVILEIKNLSKVYESKGSSVKALTDVSLTVNQGETIGIVGESGCGKTTLGRCVVRGIDATSGQVLFHTEEDGVIDFLKTTKSQMKKYRKDIQMIFQDPYASLDPRMTVFDIISEPLRYNTKMSKHEIKAAVDKIAEQVGLNKAYLRRYPHAFSGGQRQRIGIARSLILQPKVVVCDEAVSALDVSIQAQIINLLEDLQNGSKEASPIASFFGAHALRKRQTHPYGQRKCAVEGLIWRNAVSNCLTVWSWCIAERTASTCTLHYAIWWDKTGQKL